MRRSNIEVWIAVWRSQLSQKYSRRIRLDEELTERYRSERFSPPVGFILSSGEEVIDKGSDDKRILLFIDAAGYPVRVRGGKNK